MKVRANGILLHVHDEGSGTPILFVHGFPLSHVMWHEQLSALASEFRVIAPDLRGFGESEVTEGVVLMDTFADDLAAVLDQLGISRTQKIVLCGLSMGGYIAWQFVRKYSDRLQGLILCDTRALPDTPAGISSRRKLAATVLQHGTEPVAAIMLPNLFSPVSKETRQRAVELTRQCLLDTSPQGIAAASLGMAARPAATDDLPAIEIPSLLIVGEQDPISTVAEMQSIASSMPNAELVIIPAAGHLSPLENPQPVNQAIREFVNGLDQPAQPDPSGTGNQGPADDRP